MNVLRKIFIALFILLALAGGVMMAAWLAEDQNVASVPTPERDGKAQISVTTELNGEEFSYGDVIEVVSTVENGGDGTYVSDFTTSCVDPEILIDGQVTRLMRSCPSVMTEVEIAPGEELEYSTEFELVTELPEEAGGELLDFDDQLQLGMGEHRLQAVWAGVGTEPVSFYVNE